mgnify:CR=1 FL=1
MVSAKARPVRFDKALSLETRFSHEDKLVRVYWRRDAAGSVT